MVILNYVSTFRHRPCPKRSHNIISFLSTEYLHSIPFHNAHEKKISRRWKFIFLCFSLLIWQVPQKKQKNSYSGFFFRIPLRQHYSMMIRSKLWKFLRALIYYFICKVLELWWFRFQTNEKITNRNWKIKIWVFTEVKIGAIVS